MIIFFPSKRSGIGGMATFAKNFSECISKNKNGIAITSKFTCGFDTLFIAATCPLYYVILSKLLGKKIIQRLDGVHHPGGQYKKTYWYHNLNMKIIHNYFADFVIYQSEYSKLSCNKFLGARNTNYKIIYNGVNNKSIIPRKEHRDSIKTLRLITYAKFRRRDQIEPLIKSVKILNIDYTFDIFGSYTNDISDIFRRVNKTNRINFRGEISNSKLLKIIKNYDVFLFSDQSACPNSVLEAMASGLATIAFDRGSISEIVQDKINGCIVKIINPSIFKNDYPFQNQDYVVFSKAIMASLSHINDYSRNSRKISESKFDINSMCQEYLKIFNKVSD